MPSVDVHAVAGTVSKYQVGLLLGRQESKGIGTNYARGKVTQ